MKALRPLQPLVALIALATLLIVLVVAVRAISANAGFLVERQIVFLVFLGGLLVTSAVFAWIVRRSMRRADSTSSRLLLVATALALASPLTLMLMQHPAP